MAIGIMMGAVLSHLFVLGIVVQDDGGLLFSLALIVLVSSSLIALLQKDKILNSPYLRKFKAHDK